MEDNPPHDLNVEWVKAKNPFSTFTSNGKGLGQHVVQRFTLLVTLAELWRLRLKLLIGHCSHCLRITVNFIRDFVNPP